MASRNAVSAKWKGIVGIKKIIDEREKWDGIGREKEKEGQVERRTEEKTFARALVFSL